MRYLPTRASRRPPQGLAAEAQVVRQHPHGSGRLLVTSRGDFVLVRSAVGVALLLSCNVQAPLPAPLAHYAGTWQGRFLAPGRDSILVQWRWIQPSDTIGTFTFGRETNSTPTRLVLATGDSAVIDLTRPIRPMRPERVGASEFAFRLIVRVRDSLMTGTWIATPPTGPERRGRLAALRVPPRP